MASSVKAARADFTPQPLFKEPPKGYTVITQMAMVILSRPDKALEEEVQAAEMPESGQGKKYLFLKFAEAEGPRHNKWHLPGGTFREGQVPKAVLIQKVTNYIFYDLTPEALTQVYEGYTIVDEANKTCAKAHVYSAEVEEGFDPVLNEKHSEYVWMSWDEAKDSLSFIKPGYYAAIFDLV